MFDEKKQDAKYDKELFNFGSMCIREKDPNASWPGSLYRGKYYALCGGCLVLHCDSLRTLKVRAIEYQIRSNQLSIEESIQAAEKMNTEGHVMIAELEADKFHTYGKCLDGMTAVGPDGI